MVKYFGTDGIRGEAGVFLTAEIAFSLGQSLKDVLKNDHLVIGQDTRSSSNMLAYAVATGAMSVGIKVSMAGVVTTPMIAHYSKLHAVTGIMITASHNPYYDNGIKILDKGYKMTEKQEMLIEKLLDEPYHQHSSSFGNIIHTDAVTSLYKELYKKLDLEKINLSIGYDTANGASYLIAQDILSSLCDESYVINDQPNGININEACGSTHLAAIKELVQQKKLDLGFSFDGDGDRCLVVDHALNIYDGDLIIYSIAKYLKKANLLNKNTVVLTQMSNPGIVKALSDLGIKTVRTLVGDKYISREIDRHDYLIGGENSGHIILNHLLHTGDGLLVAVYLLKILQLEKVSLKTWTSDVSMYPQKMVNIKQVNRNVLEHTKFMKALENAQKVLGSNSLLLVRASGTEPLIRVTVGHQDEVIMNQVIDELVSIINDLGKEESS